MVLGIGVGDWGWDRDNVMGIFFFLWGGRGLSGLLGLVWFGFLGGGGGGGMEMDIWGRGGGFAEM